MKHNTNAFSPIRRQTDSCLMSFRYHEKKAVHNNAKEQSWPDAPNEWCQHAGWLWKEPQKWKKHPAEIWWTCRDRFISFFKKDLAKVNNRDHSSRKTTSKVFVFMDSQGGEVAQRLLGWNSPRTARTWVCVNNKIGIASHRTAGNAVTTHEKTQHHSDASQAQRTHMLQHTLKPKGWGPTLAVGWALPGTTAAQPLLPLFHWAHPTRRGSPGPSRPPHSHSFVWGQSKGRGFSAGTFREKLLYFTFFLLISKCYLQIMSPSMRLVSSIFVFIC